MTESSSSYRRILWATSVVGGATLGALIIGLVRNKAVALIGGPEAVGLFGLFTTIIAMGASIAALGIDTSAVRQLAPSVDRSPDETATTQRAIWSMAWPLALLGAASLWIARRPIAIFATGQESYEQAVGWLGLGVAGAVISAAQLAILQGHGRVGDLARVKLLGSFLATCFALAAMYVYGTMGIVAAVLAMPIVTAAVSFWFGRRLPSSRWADFGSTSLASQWKALASVGLVIMLTNGLVTFNDLSIRAVVTHRLGLQDVGFYVASSAIVWVNLSLVLNAMAADYYPRLARVVDDPEALSTTLNEQLHVGLLLAGPILAVVSLAAPLVLALLYAPSFMQSALLLRLLIAAGILRLAIWAIGFVLIARRATWSYMAAEIASALAIPLCWFALPQTGLWGAGVILIASTTLSFLVYWTRARQLGAVVSRENLQLIAFLVTILAVLAMSFELSALAGYIIGILAAPILGWQSYRGIRAGLST